MADRKITFEDANDLLAQWVDQDKQKYVPLQPGEVTHEMYAEMTGALLDTARRRLKTLVDNRQWTRRKLIVNGKEGWAYKPKAAPR